MQRVSWMILCGVVALLWSPVRAEDTVAPARPDAEAKAPEKKVEPFTLPEGSSKPAWELLVKNDFTGAEKAFAAESEKNPKDLIVLEGLRASLMAQGRYADVQRVNMKMIRAAADSKLCGAFCTRAMDMLGSTESRKALLECFKQTADAPEAIPSSKAACMDVYATLLLNSDRPAEAAEAVSGLGYVGRWQFTAGAFGSLDKNNIMERRFDPERALKNLEFKDERGKPVTVRKDVASSFRTLALEKLYPGEKGVLYAFTNLESEKDQEVLIVFGGPIDSKLYLRGISILEDNPDRQFRRVPPLLRTQLVKGSNPILVKLPFPSDLVLRVLGPDYAPLKDVAVKPLSAEALAVHEVSGMRGYAGSLETAGAMALYFVGKYPLPDVDPAYYMETLAESGKLTWPEANWLEQAARQENAQRARESIARNLAKSFPDSASPLDSAAVILGSAGRSAGHSETRHGEDARRFREHALEKVPTSHQHLLGLYYYYRDRELKDQAFEKIKACAEAHPESAIAADRLGQELIEKGLTVQGEKMVEKAAALDLAFQPALQRFHDRMGNRLKARELEDKMLAIGQETRLGRYHKLVSEGKLDEAGKLLEEQMKLYPDREDDYLLLKAGWLQEKGDVDGALALWKQLSERQPKNRNLWINRVDALVRLSRDDDARALLKDYLKTHPGDFDFRRRLRELDGEPLERWWAPYDITVDDINHSKFTVENYPRSQHAWIVDFMVTKVNPDLSRESYVHIAQKVLNQEGINDLSEVLVRAQKEDLVMIRTLNPDGSSYRPQNVHTFNLAQTASLYKVGPGSILEHAYVEHHETDEADPSVKMAFNFMDLDAPRAISRWVVMLPKSANLKIRKTNPDLIDEKILPGPDGYIVYQFTNKNVEGIKMERFMPGYFERGNGTDGYNKDDEVIPMVNIESPERAFQASGWLMRQERAYLPPQASEFVKKQFGGLKSEALRFRAIATWVQNSFQSGKEASTLEDVWIERSGNVAQLTALTVALCRAVDLKVRTGYVNRAYRPGQVWHDKTDQELWPPAVFSSFGGGGRMLVCEPTRGSDVWLQFPGGGEQPDDFSLDMVFPEQPGSLSISTGEAGVSVKRVKGEELGAAPARLRTVTHLDAQGGAKVEGMFQFFGYPAGSVRRVLSDAQHGKQVRDSLLRRIWPQAEKGESTPLNLKETDEPLAIKITGEVKAMASNEAGAFYVQPFLAQAGILRYIGPTERVHDLLIKQETANLDESLQYEAPAGYAWVNVPGDLFLCSEFGFYIADFNVKGRVLAVSRNFLLPAQRITPDKYPAFLKFLQRIAATERQRCAYAPLNAPGFADWLHPVFSSGYASHGAEEEEMPKRVGPLRKPD